MDPFRGGAPRYLTALRQFRPCAPLQESGAKVGMNERSPVRWVRRTSTTRSTVSWRKIQRILSSLLMLFVCSVVWARSHPQVSNSADDGGQTDDIGEKQDD